MLLPQIKRVDHLNSEQLNWQPNHETRKSGRGKALPRRAKAMDQTGG